MPKTRDLLLITEQPIDFPCIPITKPPCLDIPKNNTTPAAAQNASAFQYLDKLLKTTIAQLNFIRWIIKN